MFSTVEVSREVERADLHEEEHGDDGEDVLEVPASEGLGGAAGGVDGVAGVEEFDAASGLCGWGVGRSHLG